MTKRSADDDTIITGDGLQRMECAGELMTERELAEKVRAALVDDYFEGGVEVVLIAHPDWTRDQAVDFVQLVEIGDL